MFEKIQDKLNDRHYWWLFIPITILVVMGIYTLHLYATTIPKISSAESFESFLPSSSKIVDRNGELLYEIGGPMKRSVINDDKVPNIIKEATMAAEDRNFYRHPGIDVRAISRAFMANIQSGEISQGGSTITQQLIKNTVLSNEQTLDRKIKEAFLALYVERKFTKQEIMTAYLNNVSYGGNIVGITEASRTYFGKEPAELSPSEAAMLAALPKAPSLLSPYNGHVELLAARRDQVLIEMHKRDVISDEELEEALKTEIAVLPYTHPINAPHFSMMIRDQVVREFGLENVQTEGLIITTTLDLSLQKDVEQIVANHRARINNWNADNTSAVVMDPRNGELLALVGSFDYFDDTIDGQVNVAMSARQSGSAFKPIVYATLFSQGHNANSTIVDAPVTYGNYRPRNYSNEHYGTLTMRQALAGSLNVPAVKAINMTGIDPVIRIAERMGISTFYDRDRYGLSFALGAGEVRLVELTGAFGVFANQGSFTGHNTILKITDSDGEILYEKRENNRQAISPDIALQITDILADNQARSFVFGSNSPLAFPGNTVAAKTGTTNNFRDAWTIGYTTSRAVGVWAGNSDNRTMRWGADGSIVVAPMWREIMLRAMEGREFVPFERPDLERQYRVAHAEPEESEPQPETQPEPEPQPEPPPAEPEPQPPIDVGGLPDEELINNENDQTDDGGSNGEDQNSSPPNNGNGNNGNNNNGNGDN